MKHGTRTYRVLYDIHNYRAKILANQNTNVRRCRDVCVCKLNHIIDGEMVNATDGGIPFFEKKILLIV